MAMHFPHLFEPGQIGSCHLRNRIIMPLFPSKYATESKVNPKMLEFYRARARGGASLIVLDCPCLDYPRAYKGHQELRCDQDEYIDTLQALIHAIHAEGCKAFMQLNYPKERFFKEERPAAQKKGDRWAVPLANAMSREEAQEILEIMSAGAKKARDIGYDGVEIQASYGDLIAQLLSPLLNKRKDELGGVLENRAEFLTRLIRNTKTRAGHDFPVMVKLVCDEFVPGGLGLDEAKAIAKMVEASGADAIVANAGNKKTKYKTIPSLESPPAPLVDLASQVKSVVSIPVIAIGKINTPELAEEILSHGKSDFVAMARALVADPEFSNKAAAGKPEDIRKCVYCLEDCAGKGVPGIGRCCVLNPFAGHEYDWKVMQAVEKKKVLVIGGGPSGIQAAIIASKHGHDVELWERSDQLGGQCRLVHIAPYKTEMSEVLRFLVHELNKHRVTVRMGKIGNVADIVAQNPDVVIVATGSCPGRPNIPGVDSDRVIQARELYETGKPAGRKIVIVGGGDVGCETADWLSGPNKEVTVVEILPDVLNKMKKIPKGRLLARLMGKGVTIITEAEVELIQKEGVIIKMKDGNTKHINADHVVLAIDAVPEGRLVNELEGKIREVVAVGDAASPGNIGDALRSATESAFKI